MELLRMRLLRIYLDTCCYCRLFDESEQDKVIKEQELISAILDLSPVMNYVILGSLALRTEISKIRDTEKRIGVSDYYNSTVNEYIPYTNGITKLARTMSTNVRLGGFDSLHLAFAVTANADYLLTVDNDFEKASSKLNLKVKVINPQKFWEV
ncbi:MAG: PIN domain-containing protein [Chitinispirillales bacterium]|nr:PIN domain-containing protein [Chitinispirillales bacterium]